MAESAARPRRPGRRALPLVLAVAACLLFAGSASPLIDPDEARFARTSVEMLQSGNLVVPTYRGEPRLVKPPLLHWMQMAVFRALGDALRHNALYLRLSLVPLLWMAIPLALLVTQLQSIYGYTGLSIGVPALVKLEWRGAGEGHAPADVALEAPPAIRVETGAVRLASSNEVLWRVVPVSAGEFSLTIRSGSESVTKSLRVSDLFLARLPCCDAFIAR